MTIGGVRSGDIVECDVRGDRFYAIVEERHVSRGYLAICPIRNGRSNRTVTARQVIGHWRKRKARTA